MPTGYCGGDNQQTGRNLGLELRREWVRAGDGDFGTTSTYIRVQILICDHRERQVEWRKEEG